MTVYGQACINSSTIIGVEARLVQVEVSITNGLPCFSIVGMPDVSIQESRERVKSALKSCGFFMPKEKIVINLAPSSLKKIGSGFDLPIAVGLLVASRQIPADILDNYLFVGELSLDGRICEIPGLLPHAILAKREGLKLFTTLYQSQINDLGDLDVWGIESLHTINKGMMRKVPLIPSIKRESPLDFKDICGHDVAKRALQIAAVGNHNVLFVGPPGSGKTMLASRLPTILPELSESETIETAAIYSVAQKDCTSILQGCRPFISPHHSATIAGLIGGGTPLKPGDVSLAHNGVLFLDELSEFKPMVLQSLRQPIEKGVVNITRADLQVSFPSKFNLIAASNPCPCGYFGDEDIRCKCSYGQVVTYQNRIGGPLLDRFAIRLHIPRLRASEILRSGEGVSSESLKNEVMKAMEFRKFRMQSQHLGIDYFHEVGLEDEAKSIVEHQADTMHLSGRGVMHIIGVARTVADLYQSKKITSDHIYETLGFYEGGIGE